MKRNAELLPVIVNARGLVNAAVCEKETDLLSAAAPFVLGSFHHRPF